jgi:uncharacterized secreted repeat protein (TIGR03808 family)
MPIDRRRFITGALTGVVVLEAPLSAYGLDAVPHGVRPGAAEDQSRPLLRALEQASRTRAPLMLAPGAYRVGDIKLPDGAQLFGVRGATRLLMTRGPSLLSAEGGNNITISGLTLDGGEQPLPQRSGLVRVVGTKGLHISDCIFEGSGGNGIALEGCEGLITGNTIVGAADNAVFCINNAGLVITANSIRRSGNGGIRIWQSAKRHDGSLVADNTIEDTAARAGGTGENGNAINVFRAADVTVRNNTIRRAAFSAVRGNGASNIQIIGNNCAALVECAMYAEFDFEGAVIANNVIDGAENGIAVTNFDNGGRLGTVHGNLLRNINQRRPNTPPEWSGVGISIEADTAVTGNVVENTIFAGIRVGWGPYLRDVTVGGNIVRNAGYGIAVSVVPGAGTAAISGNIISGARLGSIVGMEWAKSVTGDLSKEGAERFPQLTVANNQTR